MAQWQEGGRASGDAEFLLMYLCPAYTYAMMLLATIRLTDTSICSQASILFIRIQKEPRIMIHPYHQRLAEYQ
jgi:hypothetical protein